MKIERDAQGKTRVSKGDKSGLGGQYAPDSEALKNMLKHYAAQSRLIIEKQKNNTISEMSVEEYNDAIACREALEEHYNEYNKEQSLINREFKDDYTTDDRFTYFADFTPDVPTNRGMALARSEDGEPKGWELRIGSHGSSGQTGTGFYNTREEALASLSQLQEARKNNPYVQEQLKTYNTEVEEREAVILPTSAPLGPWKMKLVFLEPEPHMTKEKTNGYHAGWCLVAESDSYNEGKPVFVNHQGYATRDKAAVAKDEIAGSLVAFEDKYRYVHVEGQGSILYNDMSHEKYQDLINSYAFKPQPWLSHDVLTDYYPKSNYPGD